MKRITIKNILSYLEGNLKYVYDSLVGLDEHTKEQVLYRSEICKDDCMKSNACIYCGCDADKKIFNKESCNGGARFPDLMSKAAWEEYKETSDRYKELITNKDE